MTAEDLPEIELLFDINAPVGQEHAIELATKAVAGIVVAWYSISELVAELRKHRKLREKLAN